MMSAAFPAAGIVHERNEQNKPPIIASKVNYTQFNIGLLPDCPAAFLFGKIFSMLCTHFVFCRVL